MITIQKLTDEAYVITVDGEESLAQLKALAQNVPGLILNLLHEDTKSLVNSLKHELWRDESPN